MMWRLLSLTFWSVSNQAIITGAPTRGPSPPVYLLHYIAVILLWNSMWWNRRRISCMQCIHTLLHRAGDGESLVSGSRRRSWWNCAPGHGPAPASALGWSAELGRVRAPSGAMEPPSGGEWEQVEDRTPLHTAHTELAPAPARPLTYFSPQIKSFIVHFTRWKSLTLYLAV